MILNNLKISTRYLLKNKAFTGINLLGLTLGFLSFILISLYLHDELSFDSSHRDADLLYRVIQHEKLEDGTTRNIAQVAARVGPTAAAELPGIAEAVRISVWGRIAMGNDPENRHQQRMMPADANFLLMFDFPLAEGDPATALQQPLSIVLTPETSRKFFGNEPALGKQIWTSIVTNGNPVSFQVAGVLKEQPTNSHLRFDMLISESTFQSLFPWYKQYDAEDWTGNDIATYVKLKPGTSASDVGKQITDLVATHYPVDKKFQSSFSLQPVRDIHLTPGFVQERTEISTSIANPFYLYSFGFVSIMLLGIACLNYLNLSTAAAYQRTREIGARKTLGAQRGQLLMQFMAESLMLSLMALIAAGLLTWMLLPLVNPIIEKELRFSDLPLSWSIALVAITLLAGLSSSIYPAFVIARIKPVEALKKAVQVGRQGLPVRKLIVSSQLGISMLMIASTLVVYRQLQFIKEKDLGITIKDQLVIDINSRSMRNVEQVRSEFGSLAEVQSITVSSRVPGEWKTFPIANVKPPSQQSRDMIFVAIDGDFLDTYNVKLLEGRNLSMQKSDSLKVMLTRLGVEQLGLTDPIGQIIEIPSVRFGAAVETMQQPLRLEIVGVTEDFHFESFRQEMMPLVFSYYNSTVIGPDYYTLTVQTSDWSGTLGKVRQAYRRIEPVIPLEYNFLTDRFADFYREDEKRGQIFLVFSAEVILIACLGLFALVSFSVERRTKEISIRKTLGASVSQIVAIIGKEFIAVFAIAALVALPLAWYLMEKWLQDFAYRISLGAGIFLIAAILALLIAVATIAVRTISAARANPVKWLRSE